MTLFYSILEGFDITQDIMLLMIFQEVRNLKILKVKRKTSILLGTK